ncbi:MAG: hypothetical protein NT029_16005 [Armatimonadetes bacterium]|nr:hypothetical protein [Armatimonadota bacterium]
MLHAAPPPPALAVSVDPSSGVWTRLAVAGRQVLAGPRLEAAIFWDGGAMSPASEWKLLSVDQKPGRTVVTRRAGLWDVRTEMAVSGPELRRRVIFTWRGEKAVRVRGAQLRTPPLTVLPSRGDWVMLPGNFPVRRMPLAGLAQAGPQSEVGWTRGDYATAALSFGSAGLACVAGYSFEHDQARITVSAEGGGVVVTHGFDVCGDLPPGGSYEVGTQVLRFALGGSGVVAGLVEALANSVGNGPPRDQPADLGKTVLYEVHPWGRLESWGPDRGHRYDRLTACLPQWRALGANAFWVLPPPWQPPWVYTTPIWEAVNPGNGTPEQLKEFVAAAHRTGAKAIVDLVVYGVLPSSEDVPKLPSDVWAVDESRQRRTVWGGSILPADTSKPAWQERMARAAGFWARDYGFDGARLDCVGWGQTANWGAPRANDAVAYGGIALNKVIRDAFRAGNPGAFLLPEGGKPLVLKESDMVFDYPLYLAMRDMTTTPDLGAWIERTREWLQWERLAYPAAGLKGLVRFLELHDTVAAQDYFGVGPSQALAAILCLMEGTPLLQQEQETGFSRDLSSWLKLRRNVAALSGGGADYQAVLCSDPGVFAFLRTGAGEAVVVAVNLTGLPARCTLEWPRSLPAAALHASLQGRILSRKPGGAGVVIDPWRPMAIVLQKRRGAAPEWRVPAPAGARWSVRMPEGTLEDAVRDDDAKPGDGEAVEDRLPVLRRAWRPVEGGLADGPGPTRLSLAGLPGAGAAEITPGAAQGARITWAKGGSPRIEPDAAPPSAAWPAAGVPAVTANPQFVRLSAAGVRLTLARRHGGVPVEIRRAGRVLSSRPGELYTDWGLLPEKRLVAADGETNPRLSVERTAAGVTVTFRGLLRERSWNGVQTCGIAGPRTAYRLTYTMDATGRITVGVGVTPSQDNPETKAFLALRLFVDDASDWLRGDAVAGGDANGRVASASGNSAGALVARGTQGSIGLGETQSVQRTFGIREGRGGWLYLALLDGDPVATRSGVEAAGGAALLLK